VRETRSLGEKPGIWVGKTDLHPTVDLSFTEIDLYTALVAIGALAGLLTAFLYLRSRSRRSSAVGPFLDGALVVLFMGWVGARAYQVLLHWDYYQARPEEISQLGLGGLGIRGGLILGFVAVLVYARVRRISPWLFMDAAALGLSIGQAFGWAGALVQGANYGIPSDSPLAIELPNIYGLVELRFPVQHAEIVLFSVLFLVLVTLAMERRPAGFLFFAYLMISSLGNAMLGFQRGDETILIGAWRADQVVDLAFCALGVCGLLLKWFEKRSNTALLENVKPGN
jgi:phosphatidylglycerol---prolipoprotein diacylglyceryl transferase